MSVCGKCTYPSRAFAKKVARRDLGAYTGGRKLETYYCRLCAGWHLTSHGKKWYAIKHGKTVSKVRRDQAGPNVQLVRNVHARTDAAAAAEDAREQRTPEPFDEGPRVANS